ncbi:MAG: hypothetical protein Q9160_004557 [Pyrenula sp. 1 TL-2023]
MPPSNFKKRRIEDAIRGKTARPKKRIRKQREYHSSSDESSEPENGGADIQTVNLDEASRSDIPTDPAAKPSSSSSPSPTSADSASEDSSSSATSDADADPNGSSGEEDDPDSTTKPSSQKKRLTKRHDPTAFTTSISKILSTKLPPSTRHDPVLSRSRSTAAFTSQLSNERLERRAKEKLKADKQASLERGRVKDVLGLQSGKAGETADEEKRLRKIAQRGVVKLFNAVRAAQVKAEEVGREERRRGTVGVDQRRERVEEVSKREFLDLIGGGGGKGSQEEKMVEEA